jgi:hypothetical protein
MDRRTLLQAFAAAASITAAGEAAAQPAGKPAPKKNPVVIYCDLAVDPAREQELVDAFHNHFKPAAETFRGKGYIDLKIVKILEVRGPKPPPGVNYRFQLTYESEEQRQVWVRSKIHGENWPKIASTLLSQDFQILVTESI